MTTQEGFRVEWIKTDKLKPAVYNPRKDLQPDDPEYRKIQKSLNEFGLVDPLVINKDMAVIGGHQRLKVLIDAGFDTVPCSIVDLDKKREKALNIALNKIAGEWDFPKLSDLLIELDTGDFDMELTGWDAKELEGLLVDSPRTDLSSEGLSEVYEIVITDLNEDTQGKLLKRLSDEGYKCKALVS